MSGPDDIRRSMEGGVSGDHGERRDLIAAVAPATGAERNLLVVPLTPIACWSVGDVRFEFDSSFVKPDAEEEIAELHALREAHKRQLAPAGAGPPVEVFPPLSIFGHGDPVGNDDYNKQLSGRRATAIYALLVRDVALWEQLYSQPYQGDDWGQSSIQAMLAALGHARDGSAGPGADADPAEAVRSFQRGNGLAADGVPGPQTRAKLFRAYMDKLAGDFLLDRREDFLARGADPGGKGDYQGCSEFNPVLVFSQAEGAVLKQGDRRDERNAQNAPNRRVVAFLFAPGARVEAARWPCPRAKEGVAGCRRRFWSDGDARRSQQERRRLYETDRDTFACRFYDLMADGSPCERAVSVMRIRLHDCFGKLMPGVRYALDYAGRHKKGHANAAAFLSETLDPSAERCTVRWDPADPGATDPAEFLYHMEPFVKLGDFDTDEGLRRRLHNLGYPVEQELSRNLTDFQQQHELEVTGTLDDPTRAKLRKIYGGVRDEFQEAQDVFPSAPDSEQRT
jgi:hypothetical protein